VVSILPPPVLPLDAALLESGAIALLDPPVVMVVESELALLLSVPELQLMIPKTIPIQINNLFILKVFYL
jgi:hypothetical protein